MNHGDGAIRPMLPSEAGEVSRVIAAAIRAGLSGHYAPEVIEALVAGNSPEAVAAHAPKQTDFVYVRGGRIAAMIGLKRNEIGHLFVEPSCAGCGIGSELVSFAAGEFRRAGYDHMMVLSSLNAAGFYAQCGFVDESRGSFPVGRGLNLDYVRMRCLIQST